MSHAAIVHLLDTGIFIITGVSLLVALRSLVRPSEMGRTAWLMTAMGVVWYLGVYR